MPAAGRAIKNGTGVSKHDNQQAFLIKFDKSITETIHDQSIPDIKFTGIPFIFFFSILFLTLSTLKTSLSVKYPVFKNEGCIKLCILRL